MQPDGAKKRRRQDPLEKYQELSHSLQQSSALTNLYLVSAILLNAAFAAWGFYIYFGVEGACERPLKELVLGVASDFAMATLFSLCLFGLIRGLFFSVASTSAVAGDNAIYQSVPAAEDVDSEHGPMVRVERSRFEELNRPVTDRISCTYASFTCLFCAFIACAIYLFTALAWVLIEKNNCETTAPALFAAARAYTVGMIVFFVLYTVWIALSCRLCFSLCEIYNAQQRLTTWSAQRVR